MKISLLNKSLSFLMAFVVVFSTLSFTVESHYCGSTLVDTAIFVKAKDCGGETIDKAKVMKGCCKNKIDVIKGQDKLKINGLDNLNLNQQRVLIYFVYTYLSLFKSLPKKIIPHEEYLPPNLICDIQVLDEAFLI